MEFIRINNRKNFLLEEVPIINPHSRKYLSWWKEQTIRCIEGFWSIDDANVKVNTMLEKPEYPKKSLSWRWLAPTAYFYCNYGTILANPIGATSGAKVPMRPSLDDIEWEFGYNWMEARGFSGFEDDPDFSCNVHLLNKDLTDKDLLRRCENENGEIIDYLQKNYFRSDGKRKQFVPCRQYIRQLFTNNMGRPVYANPPENLMILATRDGGKSYLTANQVIAHELIFDGIRRYSPENVSNPPLAEIVVGASISDKSKDLLNKVSLTMNNLKGAWKKGTNEEIPSPFFKHMSGSITPNKDWEHRYQKKIGSDWKTIGTGSKIKHRVFTTENPEAAAGGRPGTIVMEEVGLVSNILSIHASNDAAQNNSGEKFGSSIYIGTAGNMEKIVEAEMIFNDPRGYNFLAFENQEENDRGTEICWFIPATHMARKFKDANGNTMVKEATEHFLKRRALKEKSASKRGLEGEMMNYPLKPSEMFLNKTNNAFPVADVKVRIRDLMSTLNNELKLTLKGRMNVSEDGGVSFEKMEVMPIREFPLKKEDINIDGCVEIFELPMKDGDGKVPSGLYIAALDPVDDDGNDDNSRSLQSTFIMNTLTDRIVAEYSGRTKFAKEYYEQVRRLLIYYNATILYENQKKGFFTYFDNKNCLYLLEDTPPALRDVDIQKGTIIGNKGKGIYATDTINYWGRQQLLPNYLALPAYGNNEIMNLQTFKSLAGLKEMIYYNGKLNTDRISSLGLLMIHRELKLKFKTDAKKKIHRITSDPFFNRHLTRDMRRFEESRRQLTESDQT